MKWINGIERLDGEKIYLREIVADDKQAIFDIFKDESVARYEWFEPTKTIDEAMKFINNYEDEFNDKVEITWGIIETENNRLVGICCLGDFESKARRAEIGYDINKDCWGKGFATEAVKIVSSYGFNKMNLNRIEAFITPGNDSSVRVLEKCNYKYEGLVRQRDFIRGKLVDGIIMARLKSD